MSPRCNEPLHLRLIPVDADLHLSALAHARAEHAGRVETPCQLTVWGNSDDAAVAVQSFQFVVDHLVGCILQFHAFEVNKVADLASHTEPNEILSRPGTRD